MYTGKETARAPHEYRRVVGRVCGHCGKEFQGMLHAEYCSRACKQAAYRERKRSGGSDERGGRSPS